MVTTTEPAVGQRIWVFDTTLRDGEQSPGATMTVDEKLEVADALVALGVDIIEAGFPAASPGDFEAVKLIAERVKGSTVAGLARTSQRDIEQAAGAIKGAESARIHTFIATSDIHLNHKLKMTRDQVLDRIFEMVKLGTRIDEPAMDAQTIQKLMSVAIVNKEGQVQGVIQVSRKGATRNTAGPDFTDADLQRLLDAREFISRIMTKLKE